MKTETFKFLSKKRIFSLWTAVSLVFLLSPTILGQPRSTLKVVASLFPLQEFARAVGGEKVQVILLLPPRSGGAQLGAQAQRRGENYPGGYFHLYRPLHGALGA